MYLPGELIREIRKRKGLRQCRLHDPQGASADSPVTLSRIENLRQNPSKLTLFDLLSKVDMPYEQFFCPHIENQPAESFVLRRQITYLLDRAEGDEKIQALARELIDKLKNNLDLDSLINRQLRLSLLMELNTVAGGDPPPGLIIEGIKITYPEFDERDFDGSVLIFYEGDLLLSLVRCRANTGDTDRALAILRRIRDGYSKLPLSEMFKERLMSDTQNFITRLLLQRGDYSAALAASEEASALSKKLSGSSRQPDSLYLRALALFYAEGDKKQSAALLRQAYFAFTLLRNDAGRKRVLRAAREIIGVDFDTHGTENTAIELPGDFFAFTSGGVLASYNIGELLRQLRTASGARQSDVYTGICSQSFYSRLESGEKTGVGIFILEALMQRLGRDLNLYIDYFPSIGEWEEEQLRMRYLRELYIGSADEAAETHKKLTALGDFSRGLGRQFMLFSQAIMKRERGEEYDSYLPLLYDAIRITIPDFSEDRIADKRLTFDECNIIGIIADYYADNGQIGRGIAMYLGIRDSMDRFYADDSAKAKYYTALMSYLSSAHYKIGEYQKALEFADEGEAISARHGVLYLLNDFARCKALCLHKLGRSEEAAACAAMAYYSGSLTARESELSEIEAFAREELGICFSRDLGFVFHKEKAGVYAG